MCHVTVKWPNFSWRVWHESPAECVRLWCSRSVVQRRFQDCRIFLPFFLSWRGETSAIVATRRWSINLTPTLKLKSGHWYPGLSSYTTLAQLWSAVRRFLSPWASATSDSSLMIAGIDVFYTVVITTADGFLANWCVESDVSAEWLVGLWRWVLLVLVFPEDVCYDKMFKS